MTITKVVDALFCIPRSANVTQISECIPFAENLSPQMLSNGITGVVLAPCNCAQCHHQWNCAERITREIVSAVARQPKQLRGLACYDPLKIGESLRWIDEAVTQGGLAGAYAQAELCASGLDSPRMYPMYGICAKLGSPAVLDFTSRERWMHHRPQVEVVAADFPELDILLATPPYTNSATILFLAQRLPRVSFLLRPEDLQADAALCEYVETVGRERVLFRSSEKGWPVSVKTALGLPLGPASRRAYVFENAKRLFRFPAESASTNA
jgi:predicted TIM-barrel fold metal-dependent hydrolase